MMLLQQVVAYLEGRGVTSALVGGAALAVHGIARATLDYDLLVTDRSVLESGFWRDCPAEGRPEIRRGDTDDPLAGVVRLASGDEAVDIIVGKHDWQAHALQRRVDVMVEGCSVPAVDRADLILLKLFAGGPQDVLDIRLLLAADPELRGEVERRLPEVPEPVRGVWRNLLISGVE